MIILNVEEPEAAMLILSSCWAPLKLMVRAFPRSPVLVRPCREGRGGGWPLGGRPLGLRALGGSGSTAKMSSSLWSADEGEKEEEEEEGEAPFCFSKSARLIKVQAKQSSQ